MPLRRGARGHLAVALGVVVAAGLVLGACRDGGDGGRAGDGGAGASSTALEPQEVVRGGVLRVGVERPPSLDPAAARAVPPTDLLVADLLYDGLTAWEPSGGAGSGGSGSGSGEVVPALAAAWEASGDLRRWVFRLAPGRTFSNGVAVTAEHVVASFERVRAAGAASPAALLLQDVISVAVADAGTVRFELREPMATFPLALTNPGLGVTSVPPGDVGTGPFRLASRDGDVLRLERVADDAVVDGVDVHLFDDVAASYAAFGEGELDWSLVPAERAGDDGVELTPFQTVLFYGINVARPPFNDRRLREAMVRSVAAETVVERAYGPTMEPWSGIVPGGVAGAAVSEPGPIERDLDRARSLVGEVVAQSGAPVPVRVDFDAGGRQEQVAGGIAAGFEAAGFPVALRPHPFDEYSRFLVGGEHEVFRLGWTGGWPSADAYLVPLFRSDSPDNVVGFAVPAVDAALRVAMAERDDRLRNAALADIERAILERFAVIPLGQFRTAWVMSDEVQRLAVDVTGRFDATRVALDR